MLRFKDWSLGELEVAVCNALWDGGETDVRGMHERIGVPRETYPGEKRVATVPEVVEKLIKLAQHIAA